MRISRELLLIYAAAALRSFGIGLLGVVLGVYLFRAGLDSTQIGFVIASGLAGGAVATAVISVRGDRYGRRRLLVWLSLLAAIGGIALAVLPSLGALLALAFVGMLNGMGTDRSAAFALEQAILPSLIADRNRTWAFSWYNVLLDSSGALGALAAALPLMLQSWAQVDLTRAYQWVFFGYAGLQFVSAALYSQLTVVIEVSPQTGTTISSPSISPKTKSIIARLAALFSVDALGGGFLGDALVAYWFFRRFHVDEHTLGILFFVIHVLNAVSHLGAAFLASRIGLVNTMVFTHLPSSLFLVAVPFAPSFRIAMILLLLRESLVEMDVPTRQSYVAAVVALHERTYASGITNLVRSCSWAAGSSLAGVLMQHVAFSGPLVLGGGLKIGYDMLLYRAFREIKPPEERGAI